MFCCLESSRNLKIPGLAMVSEPILFQFNYLTTVGANGWQMLFDQDSFVVNRSMVLHFITIDTPVSIFSPLIDSSLLTKIE